MAKEGTEGKPKAATEGDDYVDDDGWLSVLTSWVRIVACFLTMMVTTFVWVVIMLALLPWPYERVRQGNIYGHLTGRLVMLILGNPVKEKATDYSDKTAIYISNHASPIDVFLIMWLTPTGTVGIAKKEIIWYPLFGQLYVLANHLRIDRSNPTSPYNNGSGGLFSCAEQPVLDHFSRGHKIQQWEVTSKALQTHLPIVPMVMTGTHNAWRKGDLHVRPTPITVKYLPPIRTNDWTEDKINEYVNFVCNIYVEHLLESQ
ncbi:hypothetical protein Cgig2_013212 [Carnegiea gigantea]|uniref:Phospholipid/glycerol acyltransferase domain-containing protein n=1 Tax=Carnegiea gigantea TaxID=171969 RepID=A0A9Q1QMF3_9CARY|nr:hypothetical protein Cgig2_013212 [Carnegiea gigantea]